MGVNRIFQFLVPKETKFFPLLIGQVDAIMKASVLLKTFTKETDPAIQRELYAEIKHLEHKCDRLTDEIFENLNNTFITPFDREDIHNLADKLDDVLDLITGSVKRVVLYKPKHLPSGVQQIAGLINEAAQCLQVGVKELEKVRKKPAVVKEQCDKLRVIESKADDVYEEFLIHLFEEEKDAIELVKLKEITSMLERATDQAEQVASVMKTIIVKYA